MNHVLTNLIPTSLPVDDYELYSDIIRSLETRKHIPWRVYEEVDISTTISRAANRGGYRDKPIADEPFSIKKRVKALHNHWHELILDPHKPNRWEDSDNVFLKPLVALHPLGDVSMPSTSDSKLQLSSEQEADANIVYDKWRRDRDRKVSYLKDHPPSPLGWVPITKSDMGIHNVWDNVLEDGHVEAGRHVPVSRLASSRQFKPIFRSLSAERVPFGWVPPGQQPPTEKDSQAELDALYAESDRRNERREKQDKYLKDLGLAVEEKAKKNELEQTELW
jgi:hypothetical protein